eukprot:TRINITY_DN7074_c0_g1_i4.p1 TRINITY_DN7074_c0_g1~~TRINITY_DN7074_c0_g1_i4.p1  ORF type:complete len:425 (-),score=94.11 TRINITY_DN7074_c0_g1_i4:46-1320(-)
MVIPVLRAQCVRKATRHFLICVWRAQQNRRAWCFFFVVLLIVIFVAAFLVKSAASDSVAASPANAIKIGINHLQVLVFIGSFSVDWPTVLRKFFRLPEAGASVSIFHNSISARCGWGTDFYTLFFLSLLQPLFIVVFLAFVYLLPPLMMCKIREAIRGESGDRFQQACLVLLYFIHPGLMSTALSIFDCVQVGERSLLAADLTKSCDSPTHTGWAVFSALYVAFYCFGTVAVMTWFMHEHFVELESETSWIRKRFRYLLVGYREHFHFWDIIVTLRKMLFVFFATFFSAPLQVFATVIVLFGSYNAALGSVPYADKLHQKMEIASLQLLFLTALTGGLYHTHVFDAPYGGVGSFVAVVLMLFNGGFVCVVLSSAAFEKIRRVAGTWLQVLGGHRAKDSSHRTAQPAPVYDDQPASELVVVGNGA